jgi:hypothetical protein
MSELLTREEALATVSEVAKKFASAKRTRAEYTALRLEVEESPSTTWDFLATVEEAEERARVVTEELKASLDEWLELFNSVERLESERKEIDAERSRAA